jgi:hypothetical protein
MHDGRDRLGEEAVMTYFKFLSRSSTARFHGTIQNLGDPTETPSRYLENGSGER